MHENASSKNVTKKSGSKKNLKESDEAVIEKTKKISLKDYFNFDKIDGIKHGQCLLCGKNKKGVFKCTIPMKQSNTSGLKSHILRYHKKEYDIVFPCNVAKKKPVLCESQTTLESVISVSTN